MMKKILHTLLCLGITLGLHAQTPDPSCGTNNCETAIDIELITGDPWIQICAEKYAGDDCFNQQHTYYRFAAEKDGYLQFCYGGSALFGNCTDGKVSNQQEGELVAVADCNGDEALQYKVAANSIVYIRVDRIIGIAGTEECAQFRFLPASIDGCVCRNYMSSVSTVLRCDNFENYRSEAVTDQSPFWELCEPDSGDGWITEGFSQGDGTQSLNLQTTAANYSHVVYQLGEIYQGNLQLSWWMFVPDGQTAFYTVYYNREKGIPGYEVKFQQDGSGTLTYGLNPQTASFKYPQGEWFEVVQTIDLGNDQAVLSINGWAVDRWRFYSSSPTDDLPHLGSINFSARAGSDFYIDNICFTEGNCIITSEYNPVCSNNIEFTNPGEARCFGVTNFTDAPCTDCEDVIICDFDPVTGDYILRLGTADIDFERGVTWINESTGEDIGTDNSEIITLIPTDEDCTAYTICVRYYDRRIGDWRTCCKKICICRDQQNCQYIDYLVQENGLRFQFNNDVADQVRWFYETDGQIVSFDPNQEPYLDFLPQTSNQECRKVKICAYYFDPITNCWKWCCRSVCICNPNNCNRIDFSTSDEGLVFKIEATEAEQWQWTVEFDDGTSFDLEGKESTELLRYTDVCRWVKVCVRYFDRTDKCWKACCRKVWLCHPVECEDIISCRFDPVSGNYIFSVNNPNLDQEKGLTWINETTGEEIGTRDSETLSLSPTDEECTTYSICVRYYDQACECWRTCCKKICVCRDQENCRYINYEIGDRGFQFSFANDLAQSAEWFYEEDGQIIPFAPGDLPYLDFSPQTDPDFCRQVKVCVYYFDVATGCWKWCCRKICLCNPNECGYIDFRANDEGMEFGLNVDRTAEWQWTAAFDNGSRIKLEGEQTTELLRYTGVCRWINVCVRYLDLTDNCWKVCCRRIWLCPPIECEDIIQSRFDPPSGQYIFTVNNPDIELERGITWINETTGDEYTTTAAEGLSLAPREGDCTTYSICIKYYDRNCGCWRTCCKKICLCRDEETCQSIGYQIEEDGYAFVLNSDDVRAPQWFLEENGTMTNFDPNGQPFVNFDPDNDCRLVKICCYYYDNRTGCWKWCCREIKICRGKCCHDDPLSRLDWLKEQADNCEELACGLKVYCCTYEGRKVFNLQDDPAICTDPLGRVFECNGNELFQWGGIGGINMDQFDRLADCELIWKCSKEICDNGLDDDRDGKIDCEDEDCWEHCNGGCTREPIAEFSWMESGPQEIQFKDRSLYEADEWWWNFGDGEESNEADPVHRYLEAGTYEVCLITSNDCGTSEKFCLKVKVDPANGHDVIINVGEVSGKTGDIVQLPVFLEDCMDCSAITSFETKFAFENSGIVEVLNVVPIRLEDGFFEWLPEVNGIVFTADTPIDIPNDDTLFIIEIQLVGPGDQETVATLKTDFEVELTGKKGGDIPLEYDVQLIDGLVKIEEVGHRIFGTIRNIWEQGISKVYVPLFREGVFQDYFMTDETGKYEFVDNLEGKNYTVQPAKEHLDRSVINVISSAKAYDYVKYRFGVLPDPGLSPYQIITLDVNCNDKISTLDIYLINEVILGNIDEFPGCAAWSFIPSDYQFPDPLDPFPFPNSAEVQDLDENTQLDFIGVMKGDVAFEADPTLPGQAPGDEVSANVVRLVATDQFYARGDTIQMTITSPDFFNLRAYQFAFGFDPQVLEVLDTRAADLIELTEDNFGQANESEGILSALWVNPDAKGITLSPEEGLFTLTMLAKKDIHSLADHLRLSTDEMEQFAIDANYKMLDLTLEFVHRGITTHTIDHKTEEFRLYQNTPNPFSGITTIEFELPHAAEVNLIIFNQLGQVIQSHKGRFGKGRSAVRVDLANLGLGNQVLYYQFVADDYTQTRKMLNIE